LKTNFYVFGYLVELLYLLLLSASSKIDSSESVIVGTPVNVLLLNVPLTLKTHSLSFTGSKQVTSLLCDIEVLLPSHTEHFDYYIMFWSLLTTIKCV
jgi:hypothetical protein